MAEEFLAVRGRQAAERDEAVLEDADPRGIRGERAKAAAPPLSQETDHPRRRLSSASAISSTMASASAFGSAASRIGRPTTT